MSTLETDLVQAATGTNTALTLKGKGTGVVKLGDGELSFPDSDGSANQVLQTDGSGTLSFTDTLGGSSAELADLYLADGGIIYFGDDQDVKLTHVADTGLIFKNAHTSGNSGIGAVLTLQTGDTDVADGNILGHIKFQAPDEGAGTDAILIAAAIAAESEGDFSSSNNATSLVFQTGASEAATTKMTLTSAGNLDVTGTIQGTTITAETAVVPDASDGAALGTAALEWSDLFLADGGIIYFGDDQDVTLTHSADTSLTCNLMIAATTFEPTGDTAAGDNSAIGYTAAEGLILTGQGSTNDVTIKNDADGDVLTIPTGTTNVTIAGDLTISGDDLTMATNTSGAILVADGNNYNPAVVSGDISIGTTGVAAIGAGVIVEADIADNAVTLAKMAGGTDGNIISFDASGDPVAVATGTDGQVLTSSGAGAVCAFEDAGGGGFTEDTRQATTSGSSLTFNAGSTIPAGTTQIVICFYEVSSSSSSWTMKLQIGDAGGIETSGYVGGFSMQDHSANTVNAEGSSTHWIMHDTRVSASGDKMSGTVTLSRMNESTFEWSMSGVLSQHTSSQNDGCTVAGWKALSAELTQLQISLSSGTFDEGGSGINIAYQ
jgi:hypothetical protein